MTVTSKNRFNFKYLALGLCAALAVGAPAMSAQASSAYSEPVSLTVTVPAINTVEERREAIANFRKEAMDACEVHGTRGLSAVRLQTLCADDLVEVFTTKIDKSIALAARADEFEKSET